MHGVKKSLVPKKKKKKKRNTKKNPEIMSAC
jgi:hypothetical protein